MKRVRIGLLVAAAALVGLAAAAASQTAAPAQAAALQESSSGAAVYAAKCASCHQANGEGVPGAFPPLAGNPNVADAAYVESVIVEGQSGPIEVLGQQYNGVMPPVALSSSELADVVAYVATLAGGTGTPATTAAPPAAGDPVHGKRLFAGSAGFDNGGAACVACHSAGSAGLSRGATLGPDLTDVYNRLGGDAGLTAWLTSPASATMQPLFADKPLEGGEIADLVAFLAETPAEGAPNAFGWFPVAGLVGTLLLLIAMAWFIRGPQESYTQRLRRQS